MPTWTPKPIWEGEDVFIIGGGPSLKAFDWNLLKDENVIGCNTSFQLGKEVCKICVFGDYRFFLKYVKELEAYQGPVFTNVGKLRDSTYSWLWWMPRKPKGLHLDALGWNCNTGAMVINLALLLGAARIFLLGYDMHLSEEGKANWYENLIDKPREEVYSKFLRGFACMPADINKHFAGTEVFNVTKNSGLDVFLKLDLDEFFKDRING